MTDDATRQDPDLTLIKRRTLRSAISYLGRAVSDPKYDHWDDGTLLVLLQGVIDTYRTLPDA